MVGGSATAVPQRRTARGKILPMTDLGQCPSCGDRFRPGVRACPDCGVDLVHPDTSPAGGSIAATAPAAEDHAPPAPVSLDLHELADGERRLVDELLTRRRVRHSWQGTVLVVPAGLLPEAELAVEHALRAPGPALDPDAAATVYEVADWPPAVQAKLTDLLVGAGIAHEWDDNGDLAVAEADEEAVDALFDQIDQGELEVPSDPLAVLESAHVHLARLARDPMDTRARHGLADDAGDLQASGPPFGFEPRSWRSLVDDVVGFVDELGDTDGDDVRRRAGVLRQQLGAWL